MIHHSAVSYNGNADQFDANNRYHKSLWNFRSKMGFYLGYNWEIAATGLKRQARQEGEVTAACPQGNMNDGRCIHICLDGNFEFQKPTPEQIYCLRDLIKEIVERHDIKKDDVVFHNQYRATACPGQNMSLTFVRSLVGPDKFEKPQNEKKENVKVEVLKLLAELIKLIKNI